MQSSVRFISAFALANAPIIAMAAWVNGQNIAVFAGISLAVTALATVGERMTPALTKVYAALALIAQPAIITGALSGHAWQLDTHMYFFATMAVLSTLTSIPALVVATGFVAVHHLSLNFILPELIYPGGTDLSRTILHAVILVVETTVLSFAVYDRQKQLATVTQLSNDREDEARRRAEAQQNIDSERKKSDRKFAEMIEELENELGTAARKAAHGDLTSRVSEGFESEHLNSIGAQVNELIRVVETCISAVSSSMQSVATGNLDSHVAGKFSGNFAKLQMDINLTLDGLADTIGAITGEANNITSVGRKLFDENTSISTNAEAQAQDLTTARDNMEALADSIGHTTSQAVEANRISSQATQEAKNGERLSNDALEAMSKIQDSAGKVNDIISIIESISFQTNLLALNAAVEAARAGESGKGFAVVASEVRALAQRSSMAANDIADLIKQSEAFVQEGAEVVKNVGVSIRTTSTAMDNVQTVLSDVSSSAENQKRQINDVLTEIGSAKEQSQSYASVSVAAAQRSQALLDHAQMLVVATDRYKMADATDEVAKTGTPHA